MGTFVLIRPAQTFYERIILILEEARKGSRRGVSPGFLIEKSEFEALPNGEILTHILNWCPYEASAQHLCHRSQDAAIIIVGRVAIRSGVAPQSIVASCNDGEGGRTFTATSGEDISPHLLRPQQKRGES